MCENKTSRECGSKRPKDRNYEIERRRQRAKEQWRETCEESDRTRLREKWNDRTRGRERESKSDRTRE